jgi:4-methyl-5(b-hydroxyethyl)-thiazole monophosphate biosynthesis
MAKRALVPIADGSEEIEAVCIIDTLRRAGMEVTVASVEDSLQITASRETTLVADAMIEACKDETYDLIALPGGMPGAEHLRDTDVLIELLKAQEAEGRLFGAICASPAVVLQPHGLLEGRKATCFPSFASRLDNDEAIDERVVVDDRCVTSRGPGTAIEFALTLVALLYDDETASEIGARMQMPDALIG